MHQPYVQSAARSSRAPRPALARAQTSASTPTASMSPTYSAGEGSGWSASSQLEVCDAEGARAVSRSRGHPQQPGVEGEHDEDDLRQEIRPRGGDRPEPVAVPRLPRAGHDAGQSAHGRRPAQTRHSRPRTRGGRRRLLLDHARAAGALEAHWRQARWRSRGTRSDEEDLSHRGVGVAALAEGLVHHGGPARQLPEPHEVKGALEGHHARHRRVSGPGGSAFRPGSPDRSCGTTRHPRTCATRSAPRWGWR